MSGFRVVGERLEGDAEFLRLSKCQVKIIRGAGLGASLHTFCTIHEG